MQNRLFSAEGRTALVVGSTGIVGHNLAEYLVARGWTTFGLARRPTSHVEGMISIAADLLDATALEGALLNVRPTHVFFVTWSRNDTEKQNIEVNGAMMRNLLAVVRPKKSMEHFALVTGLKHFIGPFEIYGRVPPPPTPSRESLPRLNIPNFYYTLEDEVFGAADQDGFSWSVHRPHTLIGFAPTNVMNMGMTLGVYATLCKETGRPFLFPGNQGQWNNLIDITDVRQLAEHLEWVSITPDARNQALHVTNGDIFRWNWMWGRIAEWFEIKSVPYSGKVVGLAEQMADAQPTWAEITRSYGLAQPNLERIASFWHTDADLQRPFECVTDMTKSRLLGFAPYRASDQSFFDTFARMRAERIIP